MRIGVIAPPWIAVPPLAYGGTEVVVDALVRGLSALGHEVLLCASGDSTCPVERWSVFDAAQTERMNETGVELAHVLGAYERLEGYDVVHDHTTAGPVLAAARGLGNVVATVHNPMRDRAQVLRYVARQVRLVAVSRSQASETPSIPVARVVHNAVDVEDYHFTERRGDYLLYLALINEEKGAGRAVRAAAAAGVPLILAGTVRGSKDALYFAREIEPLLDDRIRFLGEATAVEKLDLLAGARALLYPIAWPEPCSVVMIEALASGTPVITSRHGCAPEIIADTVTGFLCATFEDTVAAIANVDLIDRAACLASARSRFSAERMVRDYLEVFADAAQGGPTRLPAA
jgi:glycosyltransferase involved in cell wall biosynthesis